jgi:Cu/Ag efflux pump CusA
MAVCSVMAVIRLWAACARASTEASRLRPVITTATEAALGFVSITQARGTGAEVPWPLARVAIRGHTTATLATELLLPARYARWAT